jgi:hypothetical protein
MEGMVVTAAEGTLLSEIIVLSDSDNERCLQSDASNNVSAYQLVCSVSGFRTRGYKEMSSILAGQYESKCGVGVAGGGSRRVSANEYSCTL